MTLSPEMLVFLATISLVIVTAYYAWHTRQTVQQMKKATEASFLPHLKLSIVPFGPVAILMKIANVGRGPALNVSVSFKIRQMPETERSWETSLLSPGDSQRFAIPVGKDKYESSMNYFRDRDADIDMKAKYKDIFKNPHEVEDSVNLKEYVQQFQRVSAMLEEDESTKIRREMEKTRKALEHFESRGLRIITKEEEKEERERLKKLIEARKKKAEETNQPNQKNDSK